jgi:putative toxin-antitoxin system antitoxin component (TIGR02293 family)
MDIGVLMADYAVSKVAKSLGGKAVLRREVRTLADLNAVVMAGLPLKSLTAVTLRYTADHRSMVTSLVVPRSTMARREKEKVLSVTESERLERLARVTAIAEQALGSRDAAEEFLTTPHALLGGVPLALAMTDLGARRVETVLERIEYSLPV